MNAPSACLTRAVSLQSRSGLRFGAFVGAALILCSVPAQAVVQFFNAEDTNPFGAQYTLWNAAVAAANVMGMGTVDFENGFSDGQNISGVAIGAPDPIRITDTTSGQAIIETGAGSISGSSPIGSYAVELLQASDVQLSFSVPTFAVGFVGIDHAALVITINFAGGGSEVYALDATNGSVPEFLGIFVDPLTDGRLISSIDFPNTSGGDTTWGLDDIIYQVPEPSSLALMGVFGLALLQTRRRRS